MASLERGDFVTVVVRAGRMCNGIVTGFHGMWVGDDLDIASFSVRLRNPAVALDDGRRLWHVRDEGITWIRGWAMRGRHSGYPRINALSIKPGYREQVAAMLAAEALR